MAQQDHGTHPARVGKLNTLRLSAAYTPPQIGWIGNVPNTWAVVRVKGVVANVVDLTRESDRDDIYLALEHVESWTGRFAVANEGVAFDSQVKRFRPRDVLFGKLRPYLAKVACPGRGGVCAGEFLVLRPSIADLSAEYLEQLLRSKPLVDAIDASTFGAKMPRADWQFIGNMRLPFPPVAEQRAIVRFLNHADRRIQRYIRAKERLIELLEEQKQAIIHQAVTGQIDVRTGQPYPAYKDSGVEWLKEVPEQWKRRAVGQLFQIGRGKVTSHEYITDHPGPFPLYSSQTENQGVMGYIDTFMFDGDYLTWTTDGAHAGTVFQRTGRFSCTNVCGTLCPKTRMSLGFMCMAVGAQTKRYVRLDINPKLMNNTMSRIRISVPPLDEQEAIAEYVQGIREPTDLMIGRANLQINLLREYRTRLIADVVTGKLDVREAASILPDIDPLAAERTLKETGGPIAEPEPAIIQSQP